jgi:hypothetical protein
LHPVFDNLANPGFQGLLSGPGYHGPVVGMDLLKRDGVFQFLLGVAKQTLIAGVVINAVATLVDDGNQIGAILGDRAEQLVGTASPLFGFSMLGNGGEKVSIGFVEGSSPVENLEFEILVHSPYVVFGFLAPKNFRHELVDHDHGCPECQQGDEYKQGKRERYSCESISHPLLSLKALSLYRQEIH